jgi:flagellar motility protein MotE (MotC chaperone)
LRIKEALKKTTDVKKKAELRQKLKVITKKEIAQVKNRMKNAQVIQTKHELKKIIKVIKTKSGKG